MYAPFSAGRLFGVRTDILNQTPVEFAVLQNCSIDFDFTIKDLMGKNQFPVSVARGAGKIPIKAEVGIFSGQLFNQLFFGATLSTGAIQLAADEAHTVPASTPYTVTAANSTTFIQDEGVTYANGNLLTYTTGTPSASGQYEEAAGTYTFSSSDANASILLNYLYTTTTGEKITITNQAMGTTPYFSAVFRNLDPKSGLYTTFKANRCTSNKLSMSAKMGDFQLVQFEMTALDDGTGNIGTLSFGDTN
jgi:hypothetical protein